MRILLQDRIEIPRNLEILTFSRSPPATEVSEVDVGHSALTSWSYCRKIVWSEISVCWNFQSASFLSRRFFLRADVRGRCFQDPSAIRWISVLKWSTSFVVPSSPSPKRKSINELLQITKPNRANYPWILYPYKLPSKSIHGYFIDIEYQTKVSMDTLPIKTVKQKYPWIL